MTQRMDPQNRRSDRNTDASRICSRVVRSSQVNQELDRVDTYHHTCYCFYSIKFFHLYCHSYQQLLRYTSTGIGGMCLSLASSILRENTRSYFVLVSVHILFLSLLLALKANLNTRTTWHQLEISLWPTWKIKTTWTTRKRSENANIDKSGRRKAKKMMPR